MQSILHEFANDNVQPNARSFKRDSKYGRAMQALCDAEKALKERLNEEEKKLLEDVSSAQNQAAYLAGTDRFINGYRLGVMMTMEVFMTWEDLFASEHEK